MHVRAIALALPLALGIGCRTTHSQTSQAATAQQPGGDQAAAASGAIGTAPGDVTAHSDDRTVSGTVNTVSDGQITIQPGMGEPQALQVVPETVIQVNGQDASLTDVHEGQPVRASFATDQAGQRTAVKVEVGQPSSGNAAPDMATPPPTPAPDTNTAPAPDRTPNEANSKGRG